MAGQLTSVDETRRGLCPGNASYLVLIDYQKTELYNTLATSEGAWGTSLHEPLRLISTEQPGGRVRS